MSQTAPNWRAKLAYQIVQRYYPPAALLVGSLARNLADASSDHDMLRYRETLLAEVNRLNAPVRSALPT